MNHTNLKSLSINSLYNMIFCKKTIVFYCFFHQQINSMVALGKIKKLKKKVSKLFTFKITFG